MRIVIPLICIVIAFAACTTKATDPVLSEAEILTPRTNINVYTDESIAMDANNTTATKLSYTVKRNLTSIAAPKQAHRNEEIVVAVTEPGSEPAPSYPGERTDVENSPVYDQPTINMDTATAAVRPVIAIKKEKNGWNHATKDAVIGGVGGAIGGAIISKKKARGAIIGGIIGAAGGYIYGKTVDDKLDKNNDQFARD